ncbi:MAG: hypothetical protein Q7S03_01810 [bacterium]|nr:hypothetical protein [bacterium]
MFITFSFPFYITKFLFIYDDEIEEGNLSDAYRFIKREQLKEEEIENDQGEKGQ